MESILNSIKQMIGGISKDDDSFDTDIMIHINSVLANLNQMGVGPDTTFSIVDETSTWTDFTDGDHDYNSVKTYVYLKVKMIFDPPASSSVMESFKRQADELEWRLTVSASNKKMEENQNE